MGPAARGSSNGEIALLNSEEREAFTQDLIARMRRIEGQARGIQKMLETNRDCEEIVLQLSAMRAAISKVAMAILAADMRTCLQADDATDASRRTIERATRMFMKFS